MQRLWVAEAEPVGRPSPGGGTRAPFPGSPMANWSDREGQAHIAIVHWLRLVLPHGWRIFHAASGGLRTKREAAKFKAMGLEPGRPDIEINGALDVGDFLGELRQWTGFLEVKAPAIRIDGRVISPAGRLSEAQRDYHDWLMDLGFPVAIVTSIDGARAFCVKHRLPIRDVTDLPLLKARAAA